MPLAVGRLADEEDFAQNADYDPFEFVSKMGFAEDDAGVTGYFAVSDPVRLEHTALLQLAEAKGINADEIKAETNEQTATGTEQDYLQAFRAALKTALERSDGNSSQNAGEQSSAGSEETVALANLHQSKRLSR